MSEIGKVLVGSCYNQVFMSRPGEFNIIQYLRAESVLQFYQLRTQKDILLTNQI